MKNVIRSYLILLFLLFLAAEQPLYPQVTGPSKMPSRILFNGYLTDKDGQALSDNNYNFIIHLYDTPDSNTPVWSGNYENVIVKNGLFTLSIGTENNTLSFDKKYYLGIQINGQEEAPQRLEFGITAYSLGAKYASTVPDESITTEKIKDSSITSDKIKNLSFSKITGLPENIKSAEDLKKQYNLAGSDYEWWTIYGNIIWGPERHFIGTRNERDFVIQTWETDRMRFDPYGYILLGTLTHPVDFEVFGYSIFDYWFVDGNVGIGVNPAEARMHIDAPLGKNPLKIDYLDNTLLTIDDMGRVEITSSLSGSQSNINNYPLLLSGGEQGIGIDINGEADTDNNYVSFWDDDGMAGRIEGMTVWEYLYQPMTIATDAYLIALSIAEGIAIASFLYPLPIPTEPADIVRISSDLVEIVFNYDYDILTVGISYESGSGDYAEWLQKADLGEGFTPGDIVAVNGGMISKNTINAEKLMAVSTCPVVLGNMPEKNEEYKYEKVAFMGQIPVKVRGEVHSGDFIIPSGLNDGIGIAVEPELMTIEELDKVVGRAWTESSDRYVKMINVLVGISAADIAKVLSNKNAEHLNSRVEVVNNETTELSAKLGLLKDSIKKLNSDLKNRINSNYKLTSSNK